MKPLASARVQMSTLGLSQVVAGAAFTAVLAAAGHPGEALIGLVVGGLIFGACMFLAYGYRINKALQVARAAPSSPLERRDRTRTRALATTVLTVLFLVLLAFLVHDGSFMAGIIFGNGLAFVAVAGWLSRWERENGAQVLIEPRWRWLVTDGRRRRRGGGALDAQDFYVRTTSTRNAADGPGPEHGRDPLLP